MCACGSMSWSAASIAGVGNHLLISLSASLVTGKEIEGGKIPVDSPLHIYYI